MSEQRKTPREPEEREEASEEEPRPKVGTDPMSTPEEGKKKSMVAPEEERTEGEGAEDAPGEDT